MNPEVIYTNYRDEAQAEMFPANSYSTFVAMPFRGRFDYNPERILEKVINEGLEEANKETDQNLKPFLEAKTVLDTPGTANVITEDIVKKILYSHFFLADLTGGNAGVLLETGIAMAFKPSTQIILISQDPLEQLHFDIRNNRVLSYNPDGNLKTIKEAFLSAAKSFEQARGKYVTQLSEGLSIDAIRTLHHYALWYQNPEAAKGQPGFFYPHNMPSFFKEEYGEEAAKIMFILILEELRSKKLLWTHYTTEEVLEGNRHFWAAHVTRLGWLFIQNQWTNLKSDHCERIK
ncbi:MAG: hypothetical protein ABH952_09695 [Candidatus Omnitrophota bacterium]